MTQKKTKAKTSKKSVKKAPIKKSAAKESKSKLKVSRSKAAKKVLKKKPKKVAKAAPKITPPSGSIKKKLPLKKAAKKAVKKLAPQKKTPSAPKKAVALKSDNANRRLYARVTLVEDLFVFPKVAFAQSGASKNLLWKVLDLSIYGVSFLADVESVKRFELISKNFHNIEFTLEGKKIEVEIDIRYLKQQSNGLYRIGAEFSKIASKDVWFLAKYVASRITRRKKSA